MTVAEQRKQSEYFHNSRTVLHQYYTQLFSSFGQQHWWPGNSPEEIIVGAILTQNTAWTNVEKAIQNLKKHNLINFHALFKLSEADLAQLIRPAGYFNIKAHRIQEFCSWFIHFNDGTIHGLENYSTQQLREELLGIHGIGKETADCILLYACKRPVFVVDAYTKRIIVRHGLLHESCTYDDIQHFFYSQLDMNIDIFNEFHALIVHTGKVYCRTKQQCHDCPLRRFLKSEVSI